MNNKEIQVYPSILSSDFSKLGEEIKSIEAAGADGVHLDIMDGAFVPNLTFGPPIVKKLKGLVNIPFDAHLMVEDPGLYLEDFAAAGVSSLSFHIEARVHHHRVIQKIKDLGMIAGIAINPGTSLSYLDAVAPHIDFILIMSVNPGFGGQKFIDTQLKKIEEAAQFGLPIQIDGGVNDKTIDDIRKAGAKVLVAGSYVFGSDDYSSRIASLKN